MLLFRTIGLWSGENKQGEMKMKNRFVVMLSCLSLVVVSAVTAQEPVPVSTAAPAAVVEIAPVATASTGSVAAVAAPAVEVKPAEATNEPGEWEYKDADLQTVLGTLALRAGMNLIVGDGVAGRVSIYLKDVTAKDAMRLIVESKGYVMQEEKNIVKVRTKQSIEEQPTEVKVVTLNYAKADDVKKTLEPVMSRQGRIQVDTRSNTLVLSDTPAGLEKVLPLIRALDSQTPQVMIEARFVETIRHPTKSLGINWSGTLAAHTMILGSPPDKPGSPPLPFTIAKGLRPASPWALSTALLDVGQAQIILSYLNTDSDSETLANPRVVTVDNVKAKIAIAEQVPIPNFAFNEQTGTFKIQGFEWKEIGVILNVTPRINKNEFVTLDVTPEVSDKGDPVVMENVQIPTVSTRTATTTVLIKSGNTLVIGGLMKQTTIDSYTKVPVMGDIPGLGALFRSKKLDKTKKDLLIFLTPTIVNPEMHVDEETLRNSAYEEVFTNDKWMPKDSAKPRPLIKGTAKAKAPPTPPASTTAAPAQNFGPK